MKAKPSIERKLDSIVKSGSDKWIQEAEWYRENQDWIANSIKIALKILRALKEKPMKQTELASRMGVTAQYINKVLKGRENLSLSTIAKIEKHLKIKLIDVDLQGGVREKVTYGNSIWQSSSAFFSLERQSICPSLSTANERGNEYKKTKKISSGPTTFEITSELSGNDLWELEIFKLGKHSHNQEKTYEYN